MKRINITLISPSKTLSAYKSDSEYQSWIDTCIAQGVWGAVGNYSIQILDATAELEAKRAASDLKERSNHSGTQTSATISDFVEAAQDAVGLALANTADVTLSYSDASNQVTADLTSTGVNPGTYSSVTVDSKGRVTSASNSGAVTRFSYVSSATDSTTQASYITVAALTSASLPVGLYRFQFNGNMQSASTTSGVGVRVAPVSATMTTVSAKWNISQGTNGVSHDFEYDQIANNTNITSASVATANTTFSVNGFGLFRLTAAGTVAIQIRAETAGQAASLLADAAFTMELV
jgi:hypothetical protein